MTKIIGFAGKKQSGKNTSCNFITAVGLVQLGICEKSRLNSRGEVEVSDILGQKIPNTDYYLFANQRLSIDNKTYVIDINPVLDGQFGNFIRQYSFADCLKELCINILGLTYDQCYGTDEDKNSLTNLRWTDMPSITTNIHLFSEMILKVQQLVNEDEKYEDPNFMLMYSYKQFMTAREVLQYVGTNIFRSIKQDVWTDATIRKIQEDNSKAALISDVRFKNEIETIQKHDGIVIHLTRDPNHGCDKHESEINLEDFDGYDYVVDNANMTISEQNEALYNILSTMGILPEFV